jgi:regulatory protein
MAFARNPGKQKAPLAEPALYHYAVKALGRRMRTEVELRRLLVERAEPGPHGESAVTAVISRLKEQRYLDDHSYAETYARLRHENEKLGQRRVRRDLQQKGIRPDLIAETLEARYGQTNEEDLARQFLSQKRISKPESPKETARVMRRLVTAGFSTGVIYKILRQWNVPDESLAALENLGDDDATNSE